MAEYSLDTTAFMAHYRRQLTSRLALFAAVLMGFVFYYTLFILHSSAWLALFVAGLLAGIVAFRLRRTMQQQLAVAQSYRLLLAAGSLTRTVLGAPPLHLPQGAIERIDIYQDQLITIVTHDKSDSIRVPAQVLGRDDLLRELSQLAPLAARARQPLAERLAPLSGFAMLGLMGVFYTAENKVIILLSGGFLLGILAWSDWHIQRNKQLPTRVRRLRWLLPLIFLTVLGYAILRLRS